jgi:putative FmdB family regulatory protein
MPLYEYQCDACGHRFELIKKFSDPPLEICPKCGGAVHKLQSAPAFQFKGTGWYVTDYGKKDQSPAAKEDSGSKEASETKDSAKSEQGGKNDKSDKADRSDKSDKGDKSDKSGKSGKSERSAKSEKTETSERREKREKKEKTKTTSSSKDE